MAVATEGLGKLEDMIVRQAEATGAQVAAAMAANRQRDCYNPEPDRRVPYYEASG